MADIVLTTLNAKFIHCAFGLRYLLANLGDLRSRACLVEFDINQRPLDIAEVLLAREPKIIGFGVYIWNVRETREVIATLKRLRPDITIILGGPEVSYEVEQQEVAQQADHVITGEADLKFAEVCRVILAGAEAAAETRDPLPLNRPLTPSLSPSDGERVAAGRMRGGTNGSRAEGRPEGNRLLPKIIPAELPDPARITLPYDLYDDGDIAHRIIYVEASRGCPFTCEFCLSSLDIPVRQFPLEPFMAALQTLLDRGVRQFKFVDRTFNLNLDISQTLLQFFLDRQRPGLFVHFEMIPDRLPEALRQIIAKFPPGALQFEIGIQTFNPAVSQLISRRQNYERLADNFRFLREHTGVHLHADLIVGLPGESLASFGEGFDRLVALGPQEIQVGILKKLRGTPIGRHDAAWQMVYNPIPPYEILQNQLIAFAEFQRMRHFARYWDLVANSGNFVETTPLLWTRDHSPFQSFLAFSDWLFQKVGQHHGVALLRLAELLFNHLTQECGLEPGRVAEALLRDYQRSGRQEVPGFLRRQLEGEPASTKRPDGNKLPKRQSRHLPVQSGNPAGR